MDKKGSESKPILTIILQKQIASIKMPLELSIIVYEKIMQRLNGS